MTEPVRREIHYVPVCWCGSRSGMLFWGGVLLVLGFILLLTQLGILPGATHDLLGPVFLLALGVWVLIEASRRGDRDPFDRADRSWR